MKMLEKSNKKEWLFCKYTPIYSMFSTTKKSCFVRSSFSFYSLIIYRFKGYLDLTLHWLLLRNQQYLHLLHNLHNRQLVCRVLRKQHGY